jgi:DNA-binding FadR family transcriptional regulator
MSVNTWINDEDYVVWLWQTSHTSLQRAPAGTRPFAEAAVHALLATLRTAETTTQLRQCYAQAGPESLALIRSILPFGPGSEQADPLTDADYEWLLVLEDAAYFLRYCEITGRCPEAP